MDSIQINDDKSPGEQLTVKEESAASVKAGTIEVESQRVSAIKTKWQRTIGLLEETLGLEYRGIQRVPESMRLENVGAWERFLMVALWFSANCCMSEATVGVLGPASYGLGLKDAMICCLFGTILGGCCTAYISTFGPISGNRTLVISRYTMGWWPSKVCVLLNLVIMLGYGLVDSVVAGQMLSAVNGKGMSIDVGIVVSAVISWVLSLFGMRWFHNFERWAFIPQVLGLFLLIGCAGPDFDTATPSKGSRTTVIGNRLSYVFLCASGPIGWAPAAADFYVYFPPTISPWLTFSLTASGLCLAKMFVTFLGIGLGSGLANNPNWASAFDISAGALYVESLAPLTIFGKIFATILSLGIVANNIPGTCSAALSFQTLGPWAEKVPRVIWCTLSVIIYTVCALVGQSHFLSIFLNFLSLIGYWVVIWVVTTIEEQLIFRWKRGYDWEAWDDPRKLPVGAAGLTSFLIGWTGAILCMDQVHYVGPIAALIGEGSDIGFPIAASLTSIVYPGLRYLELRYFGR